MPRSGLVAPVVMVGGGVGGCYGIAPAGVQDIVLVDLEGRKEGPHRRESRKGTSRSAGLFGGSKKKKGIELW